ncbi:MAG TPA: hypothetical protein VFP33_12420 [Gallionella sp.]|nr:hypothetical protein [Gallionella sp.]
MEDNIELFWRNLKDNLEHARHHETMRTSTTNIVVTLSGAAFAIIGYDKLICSADIPLLLFVAVLGIYGAIFSAKETERASLHYIRAQEFRRAIDRAKPDVDFLSIRNAADEKHWKKYPRLVRLELQSLWVGIHVGITVLALILALTWAFSPPQACAAAQPFVAGDLAHKAAPVP